MKQAYILVVFLFIFTPIVEAASTIPVDEKQASRGTFNARMLEARQEAVENKIAVQNEGLRRRSGNDVEVKIQKFLANNPVIDYEFHGSSVDDPVLFAFDLTTGQQNGPVVFLGTYWNEYVINLETKEIIVFEVVPRVSFTHYTVTPEQNLTLWKEVIDKMIAQGETALSRDVVQTVAGQWADKHQIDTAKQTLREFLVILSHLKK